MTLVTAGGNAIAGPLARASSALLFVLLTACAQPEGSLQTTNDRQDREASGLQHVLDDVRENPENQFVADAYCEVIYGSDAADFPLAPLISGLLAVPQEDADAAFCLAMVEATATGELGRVDLAEFQRRDDPETMESFGVLFRKLISAHERRKRNVAGQAPETPGKS